MMGIRVVEFGSEEDPLAKLPHSRQLVYLRCYLRDLGCTRVIVEPRYFDRDYLSEFAAFYGTSARGYPNCCERLHFFTDARINREHLERSAAGELESRLMLQDSLVGFLVLRPIPAAPFGRTVLSFYPDMPGKPPRIMDPARRYVTHLVGMPLELVGIAWQQQDTAVGACATIALWSLFHSVLFDDYHGVPTTADVTRWASQTGHSPHRMFPSGGLNTYQQCEAIRTGGLEPVVFSGDNIVDSERPGFSRPRFAATIGTMIRSGYPVIISGKLEGRGRHAVCGVGFREQVPPDPQPLVVELHDGAMEFVYLHDDNIGANVRFRITTDDRARVVLKRDPPPTATQLEHVPVYPDLRPDTILTAVQENIRVSSDAIHSHVLRMAKKTIRLCASADEPVEIGLTVGARFSLSTDYLDRELPVVVSDGKALGTARLQLSEECPALSLFVGIGRIGWSNVPILDVLYDTTESDRNIRVLALVAFSAIGQALAESLKFLGEFDLDGVVVIEAYARRDEE